MAMFADEVVEAAVPAAARALYERLRAQQRRLPMMPDDVEEQVRGQEDERGAVSEYLRSRGGGGGGGGPAVPPRRKHLGALAEVVAEVARGGGGAPGGGAPEHVAAATRAVVEELAARLDAFDRVEL